MAGEREKKRRDKWIIGIVRSHKRLVFFLTWKITWKRIYLTRNLHLRWGFAGRIDLLFAHWHHYVEPHLHSSRRVGAEDIDIVVWLLLMPPVRLPAPRHISMWTPVCRTETHLNCLERRRSRGRKVCNKKRLNSRNAWKSLTTHSCFRDR